MRLLETTDFIFHSSLLLHQLFFTELRIAHLIGHPGPQIVPLTLTVAQFFV